MTSASNVDATRVYSHSVGKRSLDLFVGEWRAPLMVIDFLVVMGSFQLGLFLWALTQNRGSLDLVQLSFFQAFFFVFLGVGAGIYERRNRSRYGFVILNSFALSFVSFCIVTMGTYFFLNSVFGRLNLLYGLFFSNIAYPLARLGFALMVRKITYPFTIIGNSECINEIKEHFNNKKSGSNEVYSYVPWKEIVRSDENKFTDALKDRGIVEVVISGTVDENPRDLEFIFMAARTGCDLTHEIEFYSRIFERIPINGLSKSWLLNIITRKLHTQTIMAKRFLDVTVSGIGIIIASPLLVLISLLVRLTSAGPIFYKQPRKGQCGRIFTMYKFRTMYADTKPKHLTQIGDPRVTWIGKILRPTHFDELPQLFNIFLGHMSLVGPRPRWLLDDMEREVDLFEFRYLSLPGLTGLAQLMIGYSLDSKEELENKLSYDLYYLCNQSFLVDLRILLRTLFLFLRKAR